MRLAPQPGHAVALTLDCCPGGFDARLAAALILHRIPATCCLTATWIRQNPAALALLLAHPDLFGFANHGARHLVPALGERTVFGQPVAGTAEAIVAEVTEGAAAIAAATGQAPRWYRAATGLYSQAALPLVRGLGQAIAGYSLSADLGASLPAAQVAARVVAARPGEVIVGHLNQPHRPAGAGLAEGLVALQAAGAVFVRLDRLGPDGVAYG